MKLKVKRKRRGTTSPQLVCIEPNPGPKNKAQRKPLKDSPPAKKIKRDCSIHHSQDEIDDLLEQLASGKSKESIIREGKFSKKTVARWDKKRLMGQTIPLPNSIPKDKKKIPPPSESAVKTAKRSVPQLSEFEKGEIIMAHQLGLRPSAIAARSVVVDRFLDIPRRVFGCPKYSAKMLHLDLIVFGF